MPCSPSGLSAQKLPVSLVSLHWRGGGEGRHPSVLFLTTEWQESEAQVPFLGPQLIFLANGGNNSCLPPSVRYWIMRSRL